MNFGKILSTAVLALVLISGTAFAGYGSDRDMGINQDRDTSNRSDNYAPLPSGEGPAFSSPRVQMAPNGDRTSHYPPYYHPSPT